MNLERAAQALVECGYAHYQIGDGSVRWKDAELDGLCEDVDPLNNEAQRQALLEWYKTWAQPVGNYWVGCRYENYPPADVERPLQIAEGDTKVDTENACLTAILET